MARLKRAKKFDWPKIEKKWQRKWQKAKLFEADAMPDKPKFFVTFPYPYLNGYLHIGHTYTSSRVDAIARYKKMQGFHVLFPQAWHATGSPIDAAAKRIKEGDQKAIENLKSLGFSEEVIKNFSESKYWIKVFSKAAKKDMSALGCAIDWRRNFITTDLNPRYSKFIHWQFRKLKDLNLIAIGKHPIVWCPKDKATVQDHDRLKGEGVVPEELVLIKFKLDDLILPAATYRPETVFGVTNMWLNPETDYIEAKVDNEKWLISPEALEKIKNQGKSIETIRTVKGAEFIGKNCENPITKQIIPILPASFVSPLFGTGVVMSVPAHAPYDWIALKELQEKNPELKKIKPISLISISDYGEFPAIEICEKMQIEKQTDPKLVEATKEIYKKEFHSGVLKEITGKYAGKIVQNAKDLIISDFVKENHAELMYELPEEVVCRCGSNCLVKIVSDQWFIKYSSEEWKNLALKALAQCKLYPEEIRTQFEYVIHWLKDWAFVRSSGLGTRLPWDRKWIIESLSDSTLYPAYYTIAHLIKKIPLKKINDAFFDYVFLGIGLPENFGEHENAVRKAREEFLYWYPVDFRNSGKDLIQNHLPFYIFNHATILPEEKWPAGIAVNGYVTVEKMKMSKSKGVFTTMRDAIGHFGADIVRITLLAAAEGLNDADWDPEFAFNIKSKLESFFNFAIENYGKDEKFEEKKSIDRWFESKINQCIEKATKAMEEARFRTAIYSGFFDLQSALKWYLRRRPATSRLVLNQFIETQIKLLYPFTPHFSEELWQRLGMQSLLWNESWPKVDHNKINPSLDYLESLIEKALKDALQVLRLAKIEKKIIKIIIASDWKVKLAAIVKEKIKTRRIKEIIETAIKEIPDKKEKIPNLVQKFIKDPSLIPDFICHAEEEYMLFLDAKDFLAKELNCEVKIEKEDESLEAKAANALPGKPAIVVQ